MSATGRNLPGAERRADDFYATPAWCTRAIFRALDLRRIVSVLDPCCGDGAILDIATEMTYGALRYGLELDVARADHAALEHSVRCVDALADDWPMAQAIVTNPPYALAQEFVQRAADQCPSAIRAFLLRLNFLGSAKRAGWLRASMPDVYVLPRRPSFTGKGTDATEYAWMVWGPGRGGRVGILDLDDALASARRQFGPARDGGGSVESDR